MGSILPSGFEAYARVLHPAHGPEASGRARVRWAEVAGWSGSQLHRTSQFHSLALPPQKPLVPAPWQAGPDLGTLEATDTQTLIGLLSENTQSPDRCWFCLWDGYGWEHDQGDKAVALSQSQRLARVPNEVLGGPKVELPGRSYLLYTGPIWQALAFALPQGQTPNLWWPADRSWCVASEIDLEWTYVGGSAALVDGIVSDRRLEALPAELDDSCLFALEPHHAQLVDEAAKKLLSDGSALISTSAGRIEGDLSGAGPGATLRVSWERDGGATSGSSSRVVDGSNVDQLRLGLAMALERLAHG